jgi:hypothetical protein
MMSWLQHFVGTAVGFAFALLGCLLLLSLPLGLALTAALAFGLVFGLLVKVLRQKSAVRKPWLAPLLILLLIAWSFMAYLSRRLPEVRDIAKSLDQEFSSIQQMPGLRLSEHRIVTRHSSASVKVRFTGIPGYYEVKSFYLDELGKHDWKFKSEQRFLKDNHMLVFCKGLLKAEVFYDSEIYQELEISLMASVNGDKNLGQSYDEIYCP